MGPEKPLTLQRFLYIKGFPLYAGRGGKLDKRGGGSLGAPAIYGYTRCSQQDPPPQQTDYSICSMDYLYVYVTVSILFVDHDETSSDMQCRGPSVPLDMLQSWPTKE